MTSLNVPYTTLPTALGGHGGVVVEVVHRPLSGPRKVRYSIQVKRLAPLLGIIAHLLLGTDVPGRCSSPPIARWQPVKQVCLFAAAITHEDLVRDSTGRR